MNSNFNLSNSDFFEKIKPQINGFGVQNDAEKMNEAKNITNSIFTQYDTQNADGTANPSGDGSLNKSEFDTAMQNNVISTIMSKFAEYLDKVEGLTQPKSEEAKINDIKSMNAEDQADAIGQVLEQFINDGGTITAFDGDNLTIVDKNGVEHKESLSSMGMSKDGIEALKPFIQASIIGNEIDNTIDEGIDAIVEIDQKQFQSNSLNVAKKYYKQHGGIPQAKFDSSTNTGIMTFPDGFIVKIDNYGNEIEQ